MDTTGLYLKLLQTPLFTGMALEELQRIVSKTKMDFLRFHRRDVIVRQGDKCGRLLLVISGSVECRSFSDDGSFSVSETVTAPAALQLSRLFGLFKTFTHTLTALTEVSIISIDKNELLKLASNSVIFRLNLVNSLSTSVQKMRNDLWRHEPTDLTLRIISFFRRRCVIPSGSKMFYIKMTVIADILNDNRFNVSRALNDLQSRGLVILHRSRIEVPAMQDLLS